jgi:uncharacterized protein YutD
MVFETLVFSPLSHLTRLIARENFINNSLAYNSVDIDSYIYDFASFGTVIFVVVVVVVVETIKNTITKASEEKGTKKNEIYTKK